MSNEMKEWYNERKDDAFDAICKIAEIYEDYHYTDEEALDEIGKVLKEYNFID